MNDVIIKLHEEGWNIANGIKSPIAWKEADQVSSNMMKDAELITEGPHTLCEYTNSVVFAIDYPKQDLTNLLKTQKILPANYSELEFTAKYIRV